MSLWVESKPERRSEALGGRGEMWSAGGHPPAAPSRHVTGPSHFLSVSPGP